MTTFTASYAPDDNKLRLYASARLDREMYDRVTEAGFKFAKHQDCFVAPMWTPFREDLLIELAGEIGDEDTTLVERSEARAERFEDRSARKAEASSVAHKTARSIGDGIPFGQPILVGHHSERRHRRDVDRIDSNMRKAVDLWKSSEYWTSRAASAIAHAKYKERADVRARRIKKIEAEQRSKERDKKKAEDFIVMWQNLGGTHEDAMTLAGFDYITVRREDGTNVSLWTLLRDGLKTAEEAAELAITAHTRTIAWCMRWIEHFQLRLSYEKAMLADQGGIASDRKGPRVGGGVKCWASPRGGWSWIKKVNKVSVTVHDNWGNGGENFARTIAFDNLSAIMTPEDIQAAREAGQLKEDTLGIGFFMIEASATE
jgi:hypothetical protein